MDTDFFLILCRLIHLVQTKILYKLSNDVLRLNACISTLRAMRSAQATVPGRQ